MGDNADQIQEWNGALGQRWAEMQAALDQLTGPFGKAALEAANPCNAERVIDIGCGCGDTAFKLARAVGPDGAVLGLDISKPMLAVAAQRLAAEALDHLSFAEADAASAPMPAEQDLIFSRFGVMFFDAPTPAFTHIRRALKSSGRMAFCCWRAPRENPWAMAPLVAARNALKVESAPADPHAPGPFAFADPDRLRAILADAGFTDIEIDPFTAPVLLGPNARAAAENSVRFGPTGRFIREMGEAVLPRALDAMEAALAPLAWSDGSIAPPGAVWIVTAAAG